MKAVSLLAIGKILGTQGLRGKVKVLSYADDLHIFRGNARFYLKKEGHISPLHVHTAQIPGIQKRTALLKFQGRDSLEAVDDLIGETLFIDAHDLPEPGQDEYYWYQLIGVEVMTETGDRVGILKDIFPTGSNDVYVVVDGEKECLIPAIREVILDVDLKAQRMVIRPMEGLFKE